MNNTLETLRDALLLTLIVILMYIMYKRLLRILGKDKVSRPRARLLDTTDRFYNDAFHIEFNLPLPARVVIQVYRDGDDTAIFSTDKSLDAGDHSQEIPMYVFNEKGKYVYNFSTEGSSYYRVIRGSSPDID